MGVKRLSSFILDKKIANTYESIKKFVDINSKNNNKIYILAIDVWLFAHKFQYSCGNIIIGFSNLIIKLLLHNILPIPVFDGKPPIEKKNVILQRTAKKNKIKQKISILEKKLKCENNTTLITNKIKHLNKQIIYISKDDIKDLKQLFTLMNIPYLDAIGEADCLCAKLYKENIIDACLSDDMDILAHGCYKLIKISGKKVTEFNLEHILRKLNINYLQFVDMCILFGCDYAKTIPKIKPNLGYNLIKAYKSLEGVKEHYLKENNEKHKKFIENYKRARKIFITSSDDENIPHDFLPEIINTIDSEKIINYIKEKIPDIITDEDIAKYKINIEKINNLINTKCFTKLSNKKIYDHTFFLESDHSKEKIYSIYNKHNSAFNLSQIKFVYRMGLLEQNNLTFSNIDK